MLGGFNIGELIFFEGDLSALSLSHLLCVRSMLPAERGGLGSPVIWLDGGNTFNPYVIAEFSKTLSLDPEQVLKSIYLSRAFTCYQMSSLVLEKLWGAVERFKSKFVLISDLPFLYIQSDIPRKEAAKAFAPVVEELRASPRRGDVLVLITELESPFSYRSNQIREILAASADVVLKTRERRAGVEVKIEKHPLGREGKIVLGIEVLGVAPIDEFAGGVVDG
jgi:hypothetical protein